MTRSEVIFLPYQKIERRILGHALHEVFGGSWRVGSTLGESIHIQRTDTTIQPGEMPGVMRVIEAHLNSPEE